MPSSKAFATLRLKSLTSLRIEAIGIDLAEENINEKLRTLANRGISEAFSPEF